MSTDDPRERLEAEARQLDERQAVLDADQTHHDATPRAERDQAALRDLADATDALADDRDRHADAWDRMAESRDADGDERDTRAHARDLAHRVHEEAGHPPGDRGVERYWATRDRDNATFDRHDAADDRRRAANDRARSADLRRRARKDRDELAAEDAPVAD